MADITDPVASGPQLGGLARYRTLIALVAFLVAAAGALTEFYGGFGYRMGWVNLRTALQTLLPDGAYIAGAGAALCLLVTIVFLVLAKRGYGRAATLSAVGIVVGAVGFYIPYSTRASAAGTAPIHDISTDTDDPPAFVDALPLRAATHAANTADYLREVGRPPRTLNVPEAQHKAYPDLQPVILAGVAPADAFKRAQDAVAKMGWHLTAAHPEDGRIEAWDQTFWFGFMDDVVIRLTPIENGTKIDVRSNSRVGGGDVGTNAKRIRRYVAALTKS